MVPAILAPSSLSSYTDKFGKWKHYCSEVRNPPVPYLTPMGVEPSDPRAVKPQDIYLWLGYMQEQGTVHPRNFPTYTAVINTIHILCKVPPPIPHEWKGALPGRIAKGGNRIRTWEAREEAPSLERSGRRYGHDTLEEDQLDDLVRWCMQPDLKPADLRAAAFAICGLLYFGRDDTLVGIRLDHFSWGKHGLRLFESRFKGHAEKAGARVMFTPFKGCEPLLVLKRWSDYLNSKGVQQDWHMWRLPKESRVPNRREHVGWVRRAMEAAGCHIPFEFKIDVHMLRASATCHCLAQNISRPTVQFRAGWTSLSSMDAYGRAVLVGTASLQLFSHLAQVLNAASS